jgi:hypothetical protein
MSEQDDTAEIIEKLDELADELTGDQFVAAIRAANRLRYLQEKLTAIEQANAERSAINEAYYQQVIKETRDHGND